MIHRTVRNIALKCNGTFLENKLIFEMNLTNFI